MINFLKFRWLYFTISLIVIGCGLFSILTWGYRYSIDFIGGTNLEYQTSNKVDIKQVKKILAEAKIEVIDLSQKDKIIYIRSKALDEKKETWLQSVLEKKLSTKINILKTETVGPTLGREMMMKTIIAAIIATIGILFYMAYAFKGFNYAFSAIIANIHDFMVVVGCYSIMSHLFKAEVDTLFVTALLTTMSFSLHDTIVIFDKIREYKKYEGKEKIEYIANKALTETMVRSLNNSMTIVFMLLALTLLGGSTIKFFVATLLVGTITGTYSSPFVATPILVWLEKGVKKS